MSVMEGRGTSDRPELDRRARRTRISALRCANSRPASPIVACGEGEERNGCTATSVSSLSLSPPSFLVCLGLESSTLASVRALRDILRQPPERSASRPWPSASPDATERFGAQRFEGGELEYRSSPARPSLADAIAGVRLPGGRSHRAPHPCDPHRRSWRRSARARRSRRWSIGAAVSRRSHECDPPPAGDGCGGDPGQSVAARARIDRRRLRGSGEILPRLANDWAPPLRRRAGAHRPRSNAQLSRSGGTRQRVSRCALAAGVEARRDHRPADGQPARLSSRSGSA